MMKKVIIPIFVLVMVGCKSSWSNVTASKPFTDEKLLDSLVTKWESSNSTYLKNLKRLAGDDNEKQHIENMLEYSKRASKGFGEYEARRKSFLRFIFSNYDIESTDFIVSENFQGEKIFYTLVFKGKKITFKNLIENWREIKSQEITDYSSLSKNIRDFKRDSSCSLSSISFSLVTLFEKEGIITRLDDKSCQAASILE